MNAKELRELMYYLCVYDLTNGDEIITEGKHTDTLYIVHTGRLSVLVGHDHKQVEVAKIESGGWVGEVTLLDPGPASATVRVFIKARVFEFTHKALCGFITAHPKAGMLLLDTLCENLATRLHKTSDAEIQRDDWKIKLAEHQVAEEGGWFKDAIGKLVGGNLSR